MWASSQNLILGNIGGIELLLGHATAKLYNVFPPIWVITTTYFEVFRLWFSNASFHTLLLKYVTVSKYWHIFEIKKLLWFFFIKNIAILQFYILNYRISRHLLKKYEVDISGQYFSIWIFEHYFQCCTLSWISGILQHFFNNNSIWGCMHVKSWNVNRKA